MFVCLKHINAVNELKTLSHFFNCTGSSCVTGHLKSMCRCIKLLKWDEFSGQHTNVTLVCNAHSEEWSGLKIRESIQEQAGQKLQQLLRLPQTGVWPPEPKQSHPRLIPLNDGAGSKPKLDTLSRSLWSERAAAKIQNSTLNRCCVPQLCWLKQ